MRESASRPLDRRGLLAGATALVVSGCGTAADEDEPGGSPPERSATSRRGDIELLQAALALEQADDGDFARDHAEILRAALRNRGAEPTARAEAPATGDAAARAIAFYLDMLPKVYDERLRREIASILVVKAQLLAVARDGTSPDAFVYGAA